MPTLPNSLTNIAQKLNSSGWVGSAYVLYDQAFGYDQRNLKELEVFMGEFSGIPIDDSGFYEFVVNEYEQGQTSD